MKPSYILAASALLLAGSTAFAAELPQAKPNFVSSTSKPRVASNPSLPLAQPESVTTGAPTQEVHTFNLAVGQSTGPMVIPANTPVLITVSGSLDNDYGVGEAVLQRHPGQFIEWSGHDITPAYDSSSATVVNGYTGTAGGHIIWADYGETVDVQVASPNAIKIVNSASGYGTTHVTLKITY